VSPARQVIADHELEPLSRSLLASPSSMAEVRALACKTVITVADILLKEQPHIQTVVFAVCCGLIFYYHLRWVSQPWDPGCCGNRAASPPTINTIIHPKQDGVGCMFVQQAPQSAQRLRSLNAVLLDTSRFLPGFRLT
jgi:hypothetical protein